MENLQIIKNYSTALWADKNIQVIDDFFVDDVLVHSPLATTQGTAKLRHIFTAWHQGFSDLTIYWDDFVCEGDKVVSRWHGKGVHDGEFLGMPASQQCVNYAGVTIYTLTAGKISEYWALVDMQSLSQQIALN